MNGMLYAAFTSDKSLFNIRTRQPKDKVIPPEALQQVLNIAPVTPPFVVRKYFSILVCSIMRQRNGWLLVATKESPLLGGEDTDYALKALTQTAYELQSQCNEPVTSVLIAPVWDESDKYPYRTFVCPALKTPANPGEPAN